MSKVEPEPAELAAALCHEVGNYLAAIRLTSHVVIQGDEPPSAISSINAASILSGRLVGQVRVLLRSGHLASKPVPIERVLRDVRIELGDLLDGPIEFCFGSAAGLPDVLFSPRVLSRQVTQLLLDATECMEGGVVRLSLRAQDGGVCFVVEDNGPLLDPRLETATAPLRGRDLAIQAVRAIVGRGEGRLTVGTGDLGNQVSLWVPVAL